ncbi:MAG: 30S ribosome-binding factor RbfA [Flavobacteriales bacterium]|nr:30S ribosome-binding factor RbfA [Flavobacteriales bacterium]
MSSIRREKVASLLKKELSQILQLEARGIGLTELLTITVVRISSDLSFARVYVSVFPSENGAAAIAKLKDYNSLLRGKLGNQIGKQVRAVPEFAFFLDDSLDYAERIEDLLK